MTKAPTKPYCWICEDKECGGWGCEHGGMPLLTPAELQALDAPRLCIICEERPALLGETSNLCEACGPYTGPRRAYGEQEEADHEMEDQRLFESEHRWGAGPTHSDAAIAGRGE